VPWVVAEVFAGVGSVARGFARAGGFQVAYLNDIDPVARATYQVNDPPDAIYELRDIQKVTGRIIREAAAGRPVAGLLGCPPCQGWSAAGRRDACDRRNGLLKDFFRLVNSVYPVFFVMENVPSVADRAEFAAALAALRGRYRIWHGILNAASYGLPQSRQRVLVIGYRHDTGATPSCPPPTHAGRNKIWDYRTEAFVQPSAGTLDALLGAAPRLTRAADAVAQDAATTRPATAAAAAARARHATARVACAASLLRWIYSMAVHGTSWDPAVAAGAACQNPLQAQPEAA
jgi:DNA-cytosine methyltransferase